MSDARPFSYPIEVVALSQKGRDYKLVADAAARAAISRALGLESVELLSAELSVTPGAGGTITVSGKFTADVVQACVVTLAPVKAHIAEPVTRCFGAHVAKPGDTKADDGEGWVDPDAEIVDPLTDGQIDLGEVLTEQLSLALDPYPRAPGATFAGLGDSQAQSEASGPFAALAGLKGAKASPRRGERPDRKSRTASPSKRKT